MSFTRWVNFEGYDSMSGDSPDCIKLRTLIGIWRENFSSLQVFEPRNFLSKCLLQVKDYFDMDGLIKELTSSLDIQNFRISAFPSKIFLCGGAIGKNNNTFLSVRHYVYAYIKKHDFKLFEKIVLAEHVNQWFRDSEYTDLLELETDLAGLVAVIPLFLESPGSIAELGSFVYQKEVREKLLVILESNFLDQISFIKLGPIKKLEMLEQEKQEKRVLPYMWRYGRKYPLKEDLIEIGEDIYKDIKRFVEAQPQEPVFKKDSPAHIIILVCELISLLIVTHLREIHTILKELEVECGEKDLKKYLLIAQKLELISTAQRGQQEFFFINPMASKISYIKNFLKTNAKIKRREDWKLKFNDHLMPETTMYKNDSIIFGKHQIRFAWQGCIMKAITETFIV